VPDFAAFCAAAAYVNIMDTIDFPREVAFMLEMVSRT
jgi:hypothetical protein